MGNIKGSKRGKYNIKNINKGWFPNLQKRKKAACLQCSTPFSFFESNPRKFCSFKCYSDSRIGKKRPNHSRVMTGRISPLRGTKRPIEWRLKVSGKNSKNWKGGLSTLYHKIRRLPEFSEWRLRVYERDLFTCQKCKRGGLRLECHHIKGFAWIIKEYQIKTIKDALQCSLLWDISNGVSLCKHCHKLTDNYGKHQH